MSKLLEGKLALILGIANRWSLAYSIAQAFSREGASLVLSYLGERQRVAISELSEGLDIAALVPCDVTKDEEIAALAASLAALNRPLHAVVHSLAFANREDLERPFTETSREGFLLAQNVSAYSLVAVARAAAPAMTAGGSHQHVDLPGFDARGAELQRDGRGQSFARSLGAVPGQRAGGTRDSRERHFGGSGQDRFGARHQGFFEHSRSYRPSAPLRRNTDPAEVADTAVFLASDLARGVTGNVIFVDSGMHVMGF